MTFLCRGKLESEIKKSSPYNFLRAIMVIHLKFDLQIIGISNQNKTLNLNNDITPIQFN